MRLARNLALSLLLVACLLAVPVHALALESEPALTEATTACIVDEYGNVLFERDGGKGLPMASITKVMTAMVALDSGIPLDEPIAFQYVEYPEGAQLAGYKDGDYPTFAELLRVTLVYSGNDAASNVAWAVAGSTEAFADLMNAKAAEIGMTNTHFMNPHGLEEYDHYSCASDLCKMGRYAFEHYPFIRETCLVRSLDIVADGKPVHLESTDSLMDSYAGLLGIKTGNVASGTSFLGAARRKGVTLYACVLNCQTKEGRFADTVALLDWAYDQLEERSLAHAGWTLRVTGWQDGFWLRCPVSAERDVTGYLWPGDPASYTTVAQRPGVLVDGGSTYGTTIWRQGGRYVEGVAYTTSLSQQTPAWNMFALPLFLDDEEAA